MIYLASPYSHPDPEVRRQRFEEVLDQTARFLCEGHAVFSPILYGHPLHSTRLAEKGYEFEDWEFLNNAMIDAASEVWVLKQTGWEQSRGIAFEVAYASKQGKVVRYVEVE